MGVAQVILLFVVHPQVKFRKSLGLDPSSPVVRIAVRTGDKTRGIEPALFESLLGDSGSHTNSPPNRSTTLP